jgi:hypothetical protein
MTFFVLSGVGNAFAATLEKHILLYQDRHSCDYARQNEHEHLVNVIAVRSDIEITIGTGPYVKASR